MGQRYLIDTNTVIEYLNNKLQDSIASLIDEAQLHISVVTRVELLSWPSATLEEIEQLQAFIRASVVFNLEETIILKTIDVRKNDRVKLPDAIIAATAIVYDMVLITRNIADFRRVKDLRLLDPNSI